MGTELKPRVMRMPKPYPARRTKILNLGWFRPRVRMALWKPWLRWNPSRQTAMMWMATKRKFSRKVYTISMKSDPSTGSVNLRR